MTTRRRGRPSSGRGGSNEGSSSTGSRGSRRRRNESLSAYNRRLEIDRQRKQDNRNSETPSQRQDRIKSINERQHARLQQEDETERTARLNNMRNSRLLSLDKESEDEKLERLRREAEQKRLRIAEENPAERQERLKAQSEYKKKAVELESAEKREARLQKMSLNQQLRLNDETPDAREKRLRTLTLNQRLRLNEETPSDKCDRLEAMSQHQIMTLAEETPEKRICRREQLSLNQKKRLQLETPEEKHVRLETQANYDKRRFQEESPIMKTHRLEKARYNTRKRRALEKPEDTSDRIRTMKLRRKQYLLDETPESYADRLQSMKIYQMGRREGESDEMRRKRLDAAREYRQSREDEHAEDVWQDKEEERKAYDVSTLEMSLKALRAERWRRGKDQVLQRQLNFSTGTTACNIRNLDMMMGKLYRTDDERAPCRSLLPPDDSLEQMERKKEERREKAAERLRIHRQKRYDLEHIHPDWLANNDAVKVIDQLYDHSRRLLPLNLESADSSLDVEDSEIVKSEYLKEGRSSIPKEDVGSSSKDETSISSGESDVESNGGSDHEDYPPLDMNPPAISLGPIDMFEESYEGCTTCQVIDAYQKELANNHRCRSLLLSPLQRQARRVAENHQLRSSFNEPSAFTTTLFPPDAIYETMLTGVIEYPHDWHDEINVIDEDLPLLDFEDTESFKSPRLDLCRRVFEKSGKPKKKVSAYNVDDYWDWEIEVVDDDDSQRDDLDSDEEIWRNVVSSPVTTQESSINTQGSTMLLADDDDDFPCTTMTTSNLPTDVTGALDNVSNINVNMDCVEHVERNEDDGSNVIAVQTHDLDIGEEEIDNTSSVIIALPPHYLGKMDIECHSCKALMFPDEAKNPINGAYQRCCAKGRVQLSGMFDDFPEPLKKLYLGTDAKSKEFKKHARNYNSALSVGSFSAHIDIFAGRGPRNYWIHGQTYHRVGPGRPEPGQQPTFGQLYILDTALAAEERMRIAANNVCLPSTMEMLSELCAEVYPYGQAYMMMDEINEEEVRRAEAAGQEPAEVKMVFDLDAAATSSKFSLPTTSHVAVVYVGADGEVPTNRKIVIRPRDPERPLQYIDPCDPATDSMCYVLLNPLGKRGWDVTMKKTPLATDDERRSGHKISLMEFCCFILHVRKTFSPLFFAGLLFQQYIVDLWTRIENRRMNQLGNQAAVRSEERQVVIDQLANDNNDDLPIGRRMILPSNFRSSISQFREKYKNALTISLKLGAPSVFVTMTCNPKWVEIEENLFAGQTAADRPDLVARVFVLKYFAMMKLIKNRRIFGKVIGYVTVFEWQKRGLPHTHTLLILDPNDRFRGAADIDARMTAELPDPKTRPALNNVVTNTMMHVCGGHCLKDGVCSKKFPIPYAENTQIDDRGMVVYRRRDDGRTHVDRQGNVLTNRNVVVYNPELSEVMVAHVNVLAVTGNGGYKYIYKYATKGHAKTKVNLEGKLENRNDFKQHIEARYLCSYEAFHHTFGFPVDDFSHTVFKLALHLENSETIVFVPNRAREASEDVRPTSLVAFFAKNKSCREMVERGNVPVGFIDSRTLLYTQMNDHFRFDRSTYTWVQRKYKSNSISRLPAVSPMMTELHSLRVLLLAVKGAESFSDLMKLDNGEHCDTYLESAIRRELIVDDDYQRRAFDEVADAFFPAQLRSYFVALFAFAEVSDVASFWEHAKDKMSEDHLLTMTAEEAILKTWMEVCEKLQRIGVDFSVSVPRPPGHIALEEDAAVPFPVDESVDEAQRMYSRLNPEQHQAFDEIVKEVFAKSRTTLFFIDGPGGSGKTFLYMTLFHAFNAKGLKIACTAWTGIAANLLPNGRTAASLFGLDVGQDCKSSKIRPQSSQAEFLRSIDIFFWDEASMIPKTALETTDQLLQELMGNSQPFGGKTFVFGGDFRQVLPVLKRATTAEQTLNTIKFSRIWPLVKQLRLSTNMRVTSGDAEWTKWLIDVGEGRCNDDASTIEIPVALKTDDIVREVYTNVSAATDFSDTIILAPTNLNVDHINEMVMNKMEGIEKTYTSYDVLPSGCTEDPTMVTPEVLNSVTSPSLPMHQLKLKKGCPVILLRNLDVAAGLCNGTRLIVDTFHQRSLGCSFACGPNKGKRVPIPRIACTQDDGTTIPIKRIQIPVRLCFAMTINKSQGQTFTKVGLSLNTQVFGHGQLYVALSRVRSKDQLKIQYDTERVQNVVLTSILQ